MDVIEKIEEKQSELLDELGKTKPTDPNYKYITENIKILNDAKTNSMKEDNARLNNNEVNDINRMKVEVEMEKVKTDRWKIIQSAGSDILDVGKVSLFCYISYNMDKISYAIKDIKQIAMGYIKSRRR